MTQLPRRMTSHRVFGLVAAALVLAAIGCNRRSSIYQDSPLAPTSDATVPAPVTALFGLRFTPGGTTGGAVLRGTATLTGPAGPGGVVVTLSSSDPAVSAPPTITVPAGRDSVDFAATAQAVASDRDAIVVGSAGGRSISATVSLWTVLPTFFSFASEEGDWVGGGGVRRFAPPFNSFSARCTGSDLNVTIDSLSASGQREFWSMAFAAPRGTPLTVGTYEGATRAAFRNSTNPGIDVGGAGRGCNTISGRFVVHEADFTSAGQVRSFWATFEQHCESKTPGLFGDLRITDGPAVSGTGTCLR